ncbi:hypothetical protein [Viridibacillus arvi]|uniref:hypothetical protein n=1 Tax=Viridibacillus arvi TaxID=263475 RepID=UPI0034CF1D48
MKVKAIVDCIGLGYDLKVSDTAIVSKKLGDKLIKFGYVKEIKTRSQEASDKK